MGGRATALTLVFAFVSLMIVGCGSPPTGPSVDVAATPASPGRPATPTATVSLASLAIEDAYAIGGYSEGFYNYTVRFLLREVGGRIGATPKSIGVFNSNLRPGEHTSAAYEGESCWITELRIPPGGTLDTFYTDAGAQWLGYCWVGIDALPGLSNLGLEVIFKDDFGVEGLATSTITAFR